MRAIPSTRQRVLSEPPLQERSDASLSFHIGCIRAHEHADAPHPLVLLRSRRERPRGCRAADQHNEVAPLHSITSSARAISVGGTSRPSAFAVLRLMTNSNFVGCSIGNSEAFAPLRILTTNAAARRLRSGTFGP